MSRTRLAQLDPGLLRLPAGGGEVLYSPGFQGRILLAFGDELVHRFDCDRAAAPVPGEFNNLGGNSLWPAPEGGAFAFNYAAEGGAWLVPESIAAGRPTVTAAGSEGIAAEQAFALRNRKGRTAKVRQFREIRPLPAAALEGAAGLCVTGYRTCEGFELLEPLPAADFLIAAWSLEQFELHPGAVAFGRTAGDPAAAVNADFYGNPSSRLAYGDHWFSFALGGEARLQIGLSSRAVPELIGAYDPVRKLLVLRHTPVRSDGRYLNIADNAQPRGVWSAADLYSIFNGGAAGFFELETIGPVELADGLCRGSRLESETRAVRGEFAALAAYLRRFGLNLENMKGER